MTELADLWEHAAARWDADADTVRENDPAAIRNLALIWRERSATLRICAQELREKESEQ